jgi:hypothetical protein
MGNYLNSTLFHKSLRILQASLPIDTGNLRYNATTGFYYNNGFNLSTGGDKAPYFEILQEKESSKYYKSFERSNFTPVYRFLQNELQGQFGGGRFLKQMSPNYGTAMKTFLESRTENLEAREAVAARYGG